jgi:hypothetical protein
VAVENEDLMMPKEKLQARFSKIVAPDFGALGEPHGVLASLPLPVYVTTNYDAYMAAALKKQHKDPRRERCRWNEPDDAGGEPTIFKNEDNPYQPTVANPVVFHLFGQLDAPKSLVLTEDDYLDFLVRTSVEADLIPPRIQQAFGEASLLFLGYRPTDLDFRVLLRSLASYLPRGRKHLSVQMLAVGDMIAEAQIEKAKEYLQQRYKLLKIQVCWGTSRGFVAELKQRWEAFDHG